MKFRIFGGARLQRFLIMCLVIGTAGAWLSGCQGNAGSAIPKGWNVAASRDVGSQSAKAVLLDPTDAEVQNFLPAEGESAPAPAPSQNQNSSILSAAALNGVITALQRQPDCSLTYFGFSYSSDLATMSLKPEIEIPQYEKTLHSDALLSTVPDRFLQGCGNSSEGTTSRPLVFLGTGKNGQELVAARGTLGVVTSSFRSDGTFTQPTNRATALQPVSLLSGDLNKDANADIVSINSDLAQSSVTVFLGTDDGSYQPGVEYSLPGGKARYGVLDDLNGDGILDLLVSSDSPAFSFSIFIGNGDGTFQPPRTFIPPGDGFRYDDAFITADVNGDGFKDIVTARGQVLLGKGDGSSFTQMPGVAFPPGDAAASDFAPTIVAADFNHDGKLDLAADDGSTIRIYLGAGDGTFTAGPAYLTSGNDGFLSATDLDGDGNVDLWSGFSGNGIFAGGGYSPNFAYALMGNGDGTFQVTVGLPSGDTAGATGATSAVKKPVRETTQTLVLSAPNPTKLTVLAGQTSAAFTVTVSSPSSTIQTVTLACAGLPVNASCNFQPGSVALTASQNSMPVSITISTTANTAAIPARRLRPLHGWRLSSWKSFQLLVTLGLLAVSIAMLGERRRMPLRLAGAGLMLGVLALLAACSNGKSYSTTTFNGTPPGTYAVTVNGAGAASASTPSALTLTVTSQ